MAISLHPECYVATINGDRGWTIVVERHGMHHVHAVAVDDVGQPRGFIRVGRAAVPQLIEALLVASED